MLASKAAESLPRHVKYSPNDRPHGGSVNWSASRATRLALALVPISALAFVTACAMSVTSSAASKARPPQVIITPSSDFYTGETVTVSIKPNAYFASTGSQALRIIECEDPGGRPSTTTSNPFYCSGFTGARVVAIGNGSFSVTYTMFSTPDPKDGDIGDDPVSCNVRHYCRLFVGQNITNFSLPHTWSASFAVSPSRKPYATASATSSPVAKPTTPSTTREAASPSHIASSGLGDGALAAIAAGALVILTASLAMLRVRRNRL